MPVYEFQCRACFRGDQTMVLPISERNTEQLCECGAELVRVFQTPPVSGAPEYRMRAVTGNGEHVTGHFGKDAKRRKG